MKTNFYTVKIKVQILDKQLSIINGGKFKFVLFSNVENEVLNIEISDC